MASWRPQHYQLSAEESGVDPKIVANALATARLTTKASPNLPPIFTLKHLATLARVDYGLLRSIVRRSDPDPYHVFRIRKRPAYAGERRFRVIAVPSPGLLQLQRWMTQRVLAKVKPHEASVAYSKDATLLAAAEPHCQCRWLIKMDVRRFFESINEIAVYKVFRSLGYQPLISFEMARLCTRVVSAPPGARVRHWKSPGWNVRYQHRAIVAYDSFTMGRLPQGAPTSPMLANLAAREFDVVVSGIAENYGLAYTRYADDIALSTSDPSFTRNRCRKVIGKVYAAMGRFGLSPNTAKTTIVPPGGRKVVLGLFVDRENPRLSRDFKLKMRQHFHYLIHPDFGPSRHADARGFSSVIGLKHHLRGLIAYARQIESDFADECAVSFALVKWPM